MNRLNILIVTILFLLTTTGCAQQAEMVDGKSKRMVRISKMAGGYQLRYCYGNQSV